MDNTNPEWFWERVAVRIREDSPCWLWLGDIGPTGYGMFALGGVDTPSGYTSRRAHRVAYEMVKGAIPDGYVVDHLCRNRACVNPDHLEAVTQAVNNRRAQSHRIQIGGGGKDATIVERRRSDGGTSYRVLYRYARKQRSLTFRKLADAERFREHVKADGIEAALAAINKAA